MPELLDDGTDAGTPRLKHAQRDQVEFRACPWNDLLPDDHQARVRGAPKVLSIVMWHVLAHNLMRILALRAAKSELNK